MKWIVVCSCLVLSAAGGYGEEEKKPIPTYTNEDLERIAPLRGQTGALSQPGPTPAPAPHAALRRRGGPTVGPEQTESYWRQEARKVETRVQALRRRAVVLRAQLEEARRKAWEEQTRTSSRRGAASAARGPSTALLEQRLQALEQEIRERQEELEERGRRAGALPGWLR